ncbi:MAG: carboxypeptidase-like regulatory domain-containing protein [Bacteroidales bacterium]|nr:carboxypeptidase-like regulatory domain-containing protein [Bacteroidales bacterium]
MKHTIFIFILFLIAEFLIAQQTINKIVIDKKTGKPILFAHVYKQDNLLTGTVTNSDGRFVLKSLKKNDVLIVSHLSYVRYENSLYNITSDTIFLIPKIEKLNEVIVKGLTPYSIMTHVIDNLQKNHLIEPVMYQMYGRIAIHNKDKSELHILSEQVTNVYYKKLGKHPFAQIIRLRIKPFSEIGKRYFKGMRMVSNAGLFSDVSFIFSVNPIFNKRKLKKHYNIEILGEYIDETQNLIKIKCSHKEEKNINVILLVERNSYAISKMEVFRLNDHEVVSFKKVDNKWYFNTVKRNYISKSDKSWKPDSLAIYSTLAIFNINKNKKFESVSFKPERQIIAKEVKQFIGKWSDDFWENYDYVPLPEWIKEKIKQAE